MTSTARDQEELRLRSIRASWRRPLAIVLAAIALFPANILAWQLSATAIDSNSATVRDSGESGAQTPISAALMEADLLPDAYALVDILAGELKVKAFDPVNGGSNQRVSADADVVRFDFKNNTNTTFNVPGGFVGLVMSGEHLLSGTPTNTGMGTGEKTAEVTYTGIFQWRNFTDGTIVGTSIVQSILTTTWDENGVFVGTEMGGATPTGLVSIVNFTDTDYLAVLEVPGFTWEPGKVMQLKAQISVSASASDPGLSALLDATNTADMVLKLPDGIDVEDAGLMTFSDLSFPQTYGSFYDVLTDYWAYDFIEDLAASGVTSGCGDGNYCPNDTVTRAQMAVFLERGIRGSAFVPDPATGNVFLDVGASDFAAGFIEQLFIDGITGGCGNNNYCPGDNVTRAQMAVFLLRAKYGSGYTPPAATGVFNDVPGNNFAIDWIEQLAAEQITSGCGGGNYCPDDPVTRAQMAVFLVRTFNL